MNHVHPNMSKFFDFHKNQQQQQQNQFMMNSNPLTDQLNMANLLDTQRMNGSGNGGFMDQTHLQKQRLMNNKYDGGNVPFNSQQNRMHNTPAQYINPSVEDDLGENFQLFPPANVQFFSVFRFRSFQRNTKSAGRVNQRRSFATAATTANKWKQWTEITDGSTARLQPYPE